MSAAWQRRLTIVQFWRQKSTREGARDPQGRMRPPGEKAQDPKDRLPSLQWPEQAGQMAFSQPSNTV